MLLLIKTFSNFFTISKGVTLKIYDEKLWFLNSTEILSMLYIDGVSTWLNLSRNKDARVQSCEEISYIIVRTRSRYRNCSNFSNFLNYLIFQLLVIYSWEKKNHLFIDENLKKIILSHFLLLQR